MPFGKLNQKKAAEQVDQDMSERGSGTAFFSPRDGANNIRILPPSPDSDEVFFKSATHWNIGANKENFNCPRAVDREADCYLCELSYKLTKSKDEDDQAEGDRIRAKKTWLYNIVDLDDEDAGFQVASFGVTIHEDIGAYLKDEGNEYGDITDPEEGTNLILTKTGKGMKTKYDVRAKRKSSPLPELLLELAETENPADLRTVRPIATNAKMRAAYEGGSAADDDDDEDEEDETPQVRRKSRVTNKASRVSDEDEDEEDEAPKAKKASRVSDDEDEEEEAPKAKRSFGSKIGAKRKKR